MNIHINKLPERQPDKSFMALDTEFFGQDKWRLHRPHGKFACLTLCPVDTQTFKDPEDVYVITSPEMIDIALGRVDNTVWSFHNASYDITQLRAYAEILPRNIWDTQIIERILWSGHYDKFSLKDLARRYCDIVMDKEVRDEFRSATELTPKMIQYAADDCYDQARVTQEQYKKVLENPWAFKVWKGVDMPAFWAYQDFMGIRLDVEMWEQMSTKNSAIADELKSGFDFNPNSPIQVKKALISLGYGGLKSTGVKDLEKRISRKPDSKASEMARRVLDYRKVSKLASTYGVNFIDKFVEPENDYSVIHSEYILTGASSGRNASRSPNMQNIPSRSNPEYREPWIARPGNVLIVADMSSQEPRISCYLSRDRNLKEIFDSGNDVYSETALRVHGIEVKKGDPFRDAMKTDFLAASYGQEPKDPEHAERLQKFYDYFPDLHRWCENQRKKTTYVESVLGRRLWVNTYNNGYERNNLNHPHQSSAADQMKMAITKMHKNWKFDYPFAVVGVVHDECILDISKEIAQDVAKFVEDCMVSVAEEMCPGVPFVAEAGIGNSWRDAK